MPKESVSLEATAIELEVDEFSALSRKPISQPKKSIAVGAVTAQLHGIGARHEPLVSGIPGLPGEVVPARCVVPVSADQIGATLVVVFDDGDVRRPIVLGVLQAESVGEAAEAPATISVEADRQRIVLSADREIVLRCGEASITLTAAGKVLIHGTYVSTRSTGVNRIKGGSVQIN